MKISKKVAVAAVAAVVGLAGTVGMGVASAQTSDSRDSIVDKIAAKFSLNKDDVQAVFDEQRQEHMAERQAEFSEDLQQKVDAGDITAEQKALIEAKQDELQAAREAKMTELDEWAETNSIDRKFLMAGRGHGMAHGNKDRLQDAVDDGELTAEQKSLIEAKQDELEAAREAERDSLKQWATDNNIELSLLGGPGGHKGPGGMGGRGHGADDMTNN